jgi:hypothetical protein
VAEFAGLSTTYHASKNAVNLVVGAVQVAEWHSIPVHSHHEDRIHEAGREKKEEEGVGMRELSISNAT